MADYPISNVPRRIVYTGSAGVGPYAFPFEVLLNTDINVYKNDVLLVIATDYTVSISPTLGTGTVTLVVAATGADRITIVGSRAIQRTTDFTTGGDFFANTINTELDSQTILTQQIAETTERSIKAPVTDPTNINMTLPKNTDRAGKYLGFNNDGNPVMLVGTAETPAVSTMAYQNANSVNITGGLITGITDLAIADGGTGASTASQARTNLGLGTLATLDTIPADSIPKATENEYITGTENAKFLTPLIARNQNLVRSNEVATTSGSNITYLGLPSWVKRITIILNNVSTAGTSALGIQIGTSAGIDSSGYAGGASLFSASGVSSGATASSNSFGLEVANANLTASSVRNGIVTLTNISGNSWVMTSNLGYSVGNILTSTAAGRKELSNKLDRVRITNVSLDLFDFGSVNIIYE